MRILLRVFFYVGVLIFLIPVYATKADISQMQSRLDAKSEQINTIENELDSVKTEHQKVIAEFANAKKNTADRKNEYLNAEKDYNRGVENVDLIGLEKLAELAGEKVNTQKAYQNTQDEEKRLENEKNKLEKDIARLEMLKADKETEILEIKADMFDAQMAEPVWEEGYGESILDEDKTTKECKRLALEYARRDAMDKGGKTIIESLTKIEDFKLIKDMIKSQAKVQIVEQDNSGDYGKAIRVMEGNVIKFTAKVRLKLQSVDTYNPFREKIKESSREEEKPIVKSEKFQPPEKPKSIRRSQSTISDPKSNLYGDQTRTFLDILESNLTLTGNTYTFDVVMAGAFPLPITMPKRRLDIIWFVDIDRNKSTGQSSSGNDYNIHLFLDEHGWHSSWYKVSNKSKNDGIKIVRDDLKISIKGNNASLSFPKSYLPSKSFDWWLNSGTGNAPKWLPRTGNPHTERATFILDQPYDGSKINFTLNFEEGYLVGWTTTGNAFNFQPTLGDNPTARRRGQPSKHQGNYWIGTCEKYQGKSGQEPGNNQGDSPQGTMTSNEFTINMKNISFLIGGGSMYECRVELLIDNTPVLRAHGENHESMRKVIWDVSNYIGKKARFRLVDASSGEWGHINFDDIRF